MLNRSASIARGPPNETLGRDVRGNSAAFPSFRLVDTVSAAAGSATFAPLQFALGASKWNGVLRPQLVRPTLISPPAAEGEEVTSSLKHGTADAPQLPSLQTDPSANLKRKASEALPTSFIPYKKRAVTFSFEDDLSGLPTELSQEDLRRIAEMEPRMTEAASILLHLKDISTEVRSKSPESENEDSQDELSSLVRSSSVTSADSTVVSATTSASPTELVSQVKPKAAATRSVTPGPSGMRLAMPEDSQELNSLHCFVRAELLELFALPSASDEVTSSDAQSANARSTRRTTSTTQNRNQTGRVGLRCVYCAHLPRRARSGSTMSSFYPKSLSDIYRSVCTWQRIHFRTCRHIPPQVREGYCHLKETDRTRGKTRYWVSSALRLGLVDVGSERGGICFATKPTPSF